MRATRAACPVAPVSREETLRLCEIGTPSRLVSAPARPLGADLGQVGMERQRAHRSDERLGVCQQRIDGVVVAEGDLGAGQRHHVLSSWIFEPRSCTRAMARSAVSLARSGSPIST